MEITDNKNAKASYSLNVTTVKNDLPSSNFNIVSIKGYTVSVTSTSSDSDGSISEYEWSWNDGGSNDTTQSASHTYINAGTYKISLRVKDNDGAWSAPFSVYASVPDFLSLPVADFVASKLRLSV